ncbi:WecB/TagA/CpsF family glycosyltransferase [Burkholderia pyrrocinia]|uniref:WecB/TagA/CpsF family glycosyltransferase n=1 Tax=Burkholderia pyrrocinia TaxID=60550 RepID=UPI00064C31ED|nr:WecB/TagA/CpsF family glycosyltransferase [Burkholderia pyrrocinia]AKM04665.1 hypothetical protein ABD05_30805 [Burkholderia pyrrocinia]
MIPAPDHQFNRQTIALLAATTWVGDTQRFMDELAVRLATVERPFVVSWLNAHAIVTAKSAPSFLEDLRGSDLILRDGVGVSVLLKMIGANPGANMNGTDLIPQIVRGFDGKSIALFGTSEPYLSRAADAVAQLGGRVVATLDGFQEPHAYVQCATAARADLVILGMGMPKQERVAMMLRDALDTPCVILNGGAILDFMARRFPRAPRLWRQLRIEWLFRLILEPRRLWRRYLLGGARFAAYTIRVAASNRLRRELAATE